MEKLESSDSGKEKHLQPIRLKSKGFAKCPVMMEVWTSPEGPDEFCLRFPQLVSGKFRIFPEYWNKRVCRRFYLLYLYQGPSNKIQRSNQNISGAPSCLARIQGRIQAERLTTGRRTNDGGSGSAVGQLPSASSVLMPDVILRAK